LKNKNFVNLSQALIECGADPNVGTDTNWNPLHSAVEMENTELLEELLRVSSTMVNCRNSSGWTPMDIALIKKRVDMANTLWERGGQISMFCKPESGWTPLHKGKNRFFVPQN